MYICLICFAHLANLSIDGLEYSLSFFHLFIFYISLVYLTVSSLVYQNIFLQFTFYSLTFYFAYCPTNESVSVDIDAWSADAQCKKATQQTYNNNVGCEPPKTPVWFYVTAWVKKNPIPIFISQLFDHIIEIAKFLRLLCGIYTHTLLQ